MIKVSIGIKADYQTVRAIEQALDAGVECEFKGALVEDADAVREELLLLVDAADLVCDYNVTRSLFPDDSYGRREYFEEVEVSNLRIWWRGHEAGDSHLLFDHLVDLGCVDVYGEHE